nr:exosome complex component RRP4 homolog [Ipomoea batatas]
MQRRSPMVGYDKHLQWRTQGVEVPRRRAATELTGDTTVATTSSMVRLANNSFDQGLLLGDEMEEVARMKKIRLERALELLESFSSKTNSNASVTVADVIPVDHEDGILKGHGTAEMDDRVVATLCGVVERVNKLVYVRSLRARYKPEVGDIIVGRGIEVAPKRWRLEINSSQDAVLMLSSMNLPDGIQRRRTAVDELNMRSIFEENDVVCAEVRGFQHDGSLHLQARSQKYGKLERGQLLIVSPYLVKKRKQHFHHLDQYQIDLILGCNGFIWIGEHVDVKDDATEDQLNKSLQPNPKSSTSMIPEEEEKLYSPRNQVKYLQDSKCHQSIIYFRICDNCGGAVGDDWLEPVIESRT